MESDKRVNSLLEELQNAIENSPKTTRASNMTHKEVEGLNWCKDMVKSKTLYITRADKGGSVYIFDSETVSDIIEETLRNEQKFEKLADDPRMDIRSKLNKLTGVH